MQQPQPQAQKPQASIPLSPSRMPVPQPFFPPQAAAAYNTAALPGAYNSADLSRQSNGLSRGEDNM